ncbi:hypothetical protein OAP04_04110 [Pelagibacteraceae bacterium]|jgi:hypothetical protein|nr:hypothetical protein [Pelagibacteraceae bacterium]
MKYRLLILFFLITSCAQNFNASIKKTPFNSKGFAYIYSDEDYDNKLIKKKFNNNLFQIAHNKLKIGTLIKLSNPKTNDFIILKNTKKLKYPDFYKILITSPVATKLNLKRDLPLVEVIEVKKNKSFIAKKAKIHLEEKKLHSNAPVETVKISNISRNKKNKNNVNKDKFFINIAEFYSKKSALFLKDRIIKDLSSFDGNKLNIKIKKTNKIALLSGPYTSINLMKNDYIQLKNFGFEELDININE